jgi:nucleoid-associated protein YgaU
MDNKSKGIFDSMLNAVTNRDEKAALEAAKQHMAELEQQVAAAEQKSLANSQRADAAEKKVVELQAALSKAQTDSQAALAKVQADLKIASSAMTLLEQRATAAEAKIKAFEDEKVRAQQAAYTLEAAKAKIIASHTMTANETLSDLALKYYKHATPAYWQLIYEANKDAIGPNPNKVRPGTVLNIPVLPEDMKK